MAIGRIIHSRHPALFATSFALTLPEIDAVIELDIAVPCAGFLWLCRAAMGCTAAFRSRPSLAGAPALMLDAVNEEAILASD